METLRPDTPKQVLDALRWAVSTDTALEVHSGRTKRQLAGPTETEHRLDLSGLAGIELYEPEELVLRLGPGTLLGEVEETLAENGQMLPFEPPRLETLLATSGEPTIGGVVGAGLAGPRRFKAGGVRDYVIGVRGVSGFGEAFKSGGRVVKNVSGYDLSKLMTGSFGTLAALTQITLKVLPRPESELTVVFSGLSEGEAVNAMNTVASSPNEPSGICYLPHSAATCSGVIEADTAVLAVRLEGPQVSLDERAQNVSALVQGDSLALDGAATRDFWIEVRDAAAFFPANGGTVWRVHVPPAEAAYVVEQNAPDQWYFDWAGGLIWMHFDGPEVPSLDTGSALLVRAEPDRWSSLPPVTPMSPGVEALSVRLRTSFDPNGVMNPGRLGGKARA